VHRVLPDIEAEIGPSLSRIVAQCPARPQTQGLLFRPETARLWIAAIIEGERSRNMIPGAWIAFFKRD
jgi:hypothetical protein